MSGEIEYEKQNAKDEIFGSFYVGSTELAINVKAIQEVVNLPENIIKMPLAPFFLLGIFNLRGTIVPVINLKALLKFDNNEVSASQKVGIIDHQGSKVGLLIDSTSEILRVKKQIVDEFSYSHTNSSKVICGAIKLDSGNRIVQILDPLALVSIENIPQIIEYQKMSDPGALRVKSQHGNRKKCISFRVNEMKLGFEISGIQEIIRVSEIQNSAHQDKLCLGIVTIRGQTVPVIDFSLLLGSAQTDISAIMNKRIIVLKVGHELFGLLTDAVESINTYTTDSIMPIPLLTRSRSKMFQGCVSLDGVGDLILLNQQEVLNNEEILNVTQNHSKIYHCESNERSVGKKHLSRQAYISFKLDHLFGVSIKDVREIIEYSDDIAVTPGTPSMVKGVLNLRGQLITIVDTRSLYRMDAINNSDEGTSRKILIFDLEGERFGLVVDSLESIIVVDDEKKMKIPEVMFQKVRSQFENDIKEIVTFHQEKKNEKVLIILNVVPLISRIRQAMVA